MSSTTRNAAVVVPMPRLSDSMEEGTIVRWLVADGESVKQGQEVVEIETDKATMLFEAPADGALWILAPADVTVAVGERIARIGGDRNRAEEAGHDAPEPTGETVRAPGEVPGVTAGVIRASPVARRLAAEQGVDLAGVAGTGPGGRVLKEDVLRCIADTPPSGPGRGAPIPGARGSARRQTATRTQAIVARRMSEARSTVPDFPVAVEVEMSAAMELREQLKGVLDPVPTLNDLVIAAVARSLLAHPRLNASYAEGAFELFEQVNLGIAVAVEDELLVPVLAGADRLSLGAIATESRRLVERTRSGAVTPAELAGGTFTISNLGMFGISWFQPIINPPQAAILGVGEVKAARGSLPVTMTLTLVSDHRIVYGAHAARFLADLRDLLQNPLALLAA